MIFWALAGSVSFAPVLAAQNSADWTLAGDIIEETAGRGLLVRSNPPGATVFVDSIERGKTPLHLENIRAGRYQVRVQKEAYAERLFWVSVRPGSLMEVSLELKEAVGRVLLKIAPDGSGQDKLPFSPRVFIDGQPGQLPREAAVLELPVGFRTIRVSAFGWEDVSATLYIEENSMRELELNLKRAPFRLSGADISRKRFNPANAGSLGTTTFNFAVSAAGEGSFSALDQEGKTVFTQVLGPFETWEQKAVWDGRNNAGEILKDGLYTLTVNARAHSREDSSPDDTAQAEETLVQTVEIDSSRAIYPLTMSSGKSGLLFAPLPALLPTGSFQIEGSLFAGKPPLSSGAWESLPFSAAFRFSPLRRLEASAVLNVMPVFDEDVRAGGAGGAKWVFLDPAGGPLGAGIGAVFSWTGETGLTPFGMASGIEVYLPLGMALGRLFSIALTPAALWTGNEGFPWEGVPRVLVSGGLMMRLTHVSAGLSIRFEHNFSESAWPPSLMAGGEIKILPPPSGFVLSFMGGVWKRNDDTGGFGGIGIGMIY